MGILSTNHKVINIGHEYSAGENIGISDDYVISSKDWSEEIAQATSSVSADVSALSAAIDYVSANAGDQEVDSLVHTNSGAWNEVSSKLDTTAFSTVSGTFLTAHQDLSDYATTAEVDSTSSFLSGAIDYVSANAGHEYSGISPIGVDNSTYTISADTWVFSAGSGISLVDDIANKVTTISVTAHGGDEDVENLVKSNSASWNEVSSKLDSTAFSNISGNFLTAIPGEYVTDTELETVSGDITALIPSTAGLASESYVQTNSAVLTGMIDGKQDTLTFDYNSSDEISAINSSAIAGSVTLPITGTDGDQDMTLDEYGLHIGIPEGGYNTTNASYGTYISMTQTDSDNTMGIGPGYIEIGDSTSTATFDAQSIRDLTSVSGTVNSNSASWDEVSGKLDTTSFSDVSGSFLTAVDLTPYQTTSGMTAYQSAGDYYSASNPSGFIVTADLSAYVRNDTQLLAIGIRNYVETYNTATQNPVYDSFAFGTNNSAASTAVSLGRENSAVNNSFAQGIMNKAQSNSLAQGTTNSAFRFSFAQGSMNFAAGVINKNGSFSQGYKNSAYSGSFAQGSYNVASAYSFAQGGRASTTNSAIDHSLAQGGRLVATGYSLAQGDQCWATDYSIAQGAGAIASYYSQAFGQGTIASSSGMAIGTYNATDSAAFVIGNGENGTERSDAFIVYHDGEVSAAGDIKASGVSLTSLSTTKQDTLTFGYDEQDRINQINSSAIAGGTDLVFTYVEV